MPSSPRARPRASFLPALAALGLHAGLLWVLVLLVGHDGPTGPTAQPTVHLLSPVPLGGGGGESQRSGPLSVAPPPPAPPAAAIPVEPEDADALSAAPGPTGDAPGSGGGAGGGTGPGLGSGTGPGTGPVDSTPPDRSAPPRPRQEVLPPLDYPRTLRGRSVDVTFWVGVDGRVERVEVSPPLDDARFHRSFLEAMRRYRFHPARGPDGSPVRGTRTLAITF